MNPLHVWISIKDHALGEPHDQNVNFSSTNTQIRSLEIQLLYFNSVNCVYYIFCKKESFHAITKRLRQLCKDPFF